MIKCKAAGKDGHPDVIIIGLSFQNLARLQQQRPILVKGSELDVPLDIAIMAGETEEAIIAEMKEHGALPPDFDPGPLRPGDYRKLI